MIKIRSLLLIIFLVNIISAREADFLIVQDPKALQIFNKYEQRLNPAQKLIFPSFCALEIITSDLLLSDSYTPAVEVSYNNRTFYIIKERKGDLAFTDKAGFIKTYHRATVLYDTIEILDNEVSSLNIKKFPNLTSSEKFKKGSLLRRVFRIRQGTYIQSLQSPAKFSWVDLKEGTYRKFLASISDFELNKESGAILEQVIRKTEQINTLYLRLFADLNYQSGENYQVSRWQIEQVHEGLFLKFLPDERVQYYGRSIRRFQQEIEFILLGSQYIQTNGTGIIHIKARL